MAGEEIVIRDDKGTEHVFPPGFDKQKAIAIVKAATTTQSPSETPGTNSGLAIAAASRVAPVAELVKQGGTAILAAPNAPRVIQRAIGAGVRAVATGTGAAIGGVPGAIGGAAMSEGLTPTQQTIRGWLGRSAPASSAAVSHTGDAVVNYIEAMGADVKNLKGAALEYAKKAGRAIIYDASGRASLVPAEAANAPAVAVKTAEPVLSRGVSALSRGLSVASGAQGALDLAQMSEPERRDIGFLGIGASVSDQDLMMGLIEKRGMTPQRAAFAVAKGDGAKMSSLMNAYIKAKK